MIPLLVPEISPCDGFCDEERRGIGYSSSWIIRKSDILGTPRWGSHIHSFLSIQINILSISSTSINFHNCFYLCLSIFIYFQFSFIWSAMIKRTLGLASRKLYKLVLIQQHKIQGWVSLVSGPFSCPAYWQYYCGLQLQIWEDDIETRNPETYSLGQKHKTQKHIYMYAAILLSAVYSAFGLFCF